ncbi:zinc ribbon domain-containing protein [bacterium]|nr:zinc ribbon domain-containing protein [bacterium]
MPESSEEIQISNLEFVFVVGIIGCMLFATWELGHLMADEWLRDWVRQNSFTNKRIILYGIAFLMAIPSIIITSFYSPKFGRFGATVNRAFLWYGTLLLISTIAIFVFDCLPEVCAGFIGAAIFITAIYILQKRFFTKDRVIRIRLNKGRCPGCEAILRTDAFFCSNCGREVGKKCPECQGFTRIKDKHCSHCGAQII